MYKTFLLTLVSLSFVAPAAAFACSSDYSCGVGYICVKEPYKTRGECMKAVDEYGIQTFELPRERSIGPKISGEGCTFVTDCPIGFKCDRDLEVCVKN